jgi:hypothetical protein
LEVQENSLDPNELFVIAEGIFGYQKTIYLDKTNFKIHFFSERDKSITLLKAESSLPTKYLGKYRNNFLVTNERESKLFTIDVGNLKLHPSDYEYCCSIDKKINHYKGLIYGLVCGIYMTSRAEEKFFRKLLREITNSYSEIRNKKYSKKNNNFNESPSPGVLEERWLELIDLAEQTYFDLVFEDELSDDNLLAENLVKMSFFNHIQDALLYISFKKADDLIHNSKTFLDLKRRFTESSRESDFANSFPTLKEYFRKFIFEHPGNTTKDKRMLYEVDDKIKVLLFEIDRSMDNHFTIANKNDINIENLHYDFQDNKIQINSEFFDLTSQEKVDIQSIINIILQNSVESRPKLIQREVLLSIVKQVGNLFSKGNKETFLFQYLNNEINTYEIDKVSNIVMKNFVAFIFNFDSLEKLKGFVNAKNVDKEWIGYTFWGTFNGFSNLSGSFTKSVFQDGNDLMQDKIDRHFQKEILNQYFYQSKELSLNVSTELMNFYSKYIEGVFQISFDDFISVYLIRDFDSFYDAVKRKFKISKKDSSKLFKVLKNVGDSPTLF